MLATSSITCSGRWKRELAFSEGRPCRGAAARVTAREREGRRGAERHQCSPHLLPCGAAADGLDGVRQLQDRDRVQVVIRSRTEAGVLLRMHQAASLPATPPAPSPGSLAHRLAGRLGQRLLRVLPHVPEPVCNGPAHSQARDGAAQRPLSALGVVQLAVGGRRPAGATGDSAGLAGLLCHGTRAQPKGFALQHVRCWDGWRRAPWTTEVAATTKGWEVAELEN